jgi:hypothetical protein
VGVRHRGPQQYSIEDPLLCTVKIVFVIPDHASRRGLSTELSERPLGTFVC